MILKIWFIFHILLFVVTIGKYFRKLVLMEGDYLDSIAFIIVAGVFLIANILMLIYVW